MFFSSLLKEVSQRIGAVIQNTIIQKVSVAPCTVGRVPSRGQGSSGFLRSISSAPEQQKQIINDIKFKERAAVCC